MSLHVSQWQSLHSRCPGGCCAGTCAGAVLRVLARWCVPLGTALGVAAFVMAQNIRTAAVWLGVQVTLEGEMSRSVAQNTTFWGSVADGFEDGFWLSQGANTLLSGVWPYLCALGVLLLWFAPRPLSAWNTALVLCSKWSIWYLVFAFMQALAFQYRAVITVSLIPGLEFFTFLDVDVQASDGVYLIAFGGITLQVAGNVVFIADRCLRETAAGAKGGYAEGRRRSSGGGGDDAQECYPLFMTVFWRTARGAEYNLACPRCLAVLWAGSCQLVVAALLVGGVALTAEALVTDLFTLQQQDGIELELSLQEPNRTEALLPLTFAVANGALAGPGVELALYEQIGQTVLSSIFFLVFILAPLSLFALLLVAWTAPLSPRWRDAAINAAVLSQSWNCQDLFAIVLMVARYEILDLTGVLADGACADAADLIPGLVTEGEYCLATGLQLRTGVIVLGAAAAAQWLALGAVHKLVSIDREDQPYYPLPQAEAGGLSRTVTATWGSGVKAALWGADELAIARDAIDTSHGDGAVWAHDAPDERSSFARTDRRDTGSSGYTSYGSARSDGGYGSRRRGRGPRASVNEVSRGGGGGACAVQ